MCTILRAWLERLQLINNALASTPSWSQTTGAQDVSPRNRLKCRLFLVSFLLNVNMHICTHTQLMYSCTQVGNDSSKFLLSLLFWKCWAPVQPCLPLTLFHPSVLYTALLVQEYIYGHRVTNCVSGLLHCVLQFEEKWKLGSCVCCVHALWHWAPRLPPVCIYFNTSYLLLCFSEKPFQPKQEWRKGFLLANTSMDRPSWWIVRAAICRNMASWLLTKSPSNLRLQPQPIFLEVMPPIVGWTFPHQLSIKIILCKHCHRPI